MQGGSEENSGGDSDGDIRGDVGRHFQGDLEGYSECYWEGRSERNLRRHPGHYTRSHSDCNLRDYLQGNVEDYFRGDLPGGLGNYEQDWVLSPLSCWSVVANGIWLARSVGRELGQEQVVRAVRRRRRDVVSAGHDVAAVSRPAYAHGDAVA